MVDWLEELLTLVEDEDEEDRQENMTAGTAEAIYSVPAVETEEESIPEGGMERAVPGRTEEIPGAARALGQAAALRPAAAERRDEMSEAEANREKSEAAELLWDKLTAPVTGRKGTVAPQKPSAEHEELPELTGLRHQTDIPAELGRGLDLMAEEGGLEGLYRQTVRASRPVVQAALVEQAGRAFRTEEPERFAALTVDELDWAVRRDSRRYDGGMTLF